MRKFTIMLGTLAMIAAAPVLAAGTGRTLSGAAIGAGAGAIVAGPVGAVAGGVAGAAIGGPSLHSGPAQHRRLAARHRIYWTDRGGHRHWRWG